MNVFISTSWIGQTYGALILTGKNVALVVRSHDKVAVASNTKHCIVSFARINFHVKQIAVPVMKTVHFMHFQRTEPQKVLMIPG